MITGRPIKLLPAQQLLPQGVNHLPKIEFDQVSSGQSIEAVVNENIYRNYKVTTTYDGNNYTQRAEISRSGKVVALIDPYETTLSSEAMRVRFQSLLGSGTKQLVISQSSGGAHCCNLYRIYDLYPRFRLIFISDDFPVWDYIEDFEFVDVDRDGNMELIDDINTFADYEAVFSLSVMPKMIFKYDRRKGKYQPANRLFRSQALGDIEKEKRAIVQFNRRFTELKWADDYWTYKYEILHVLLRYVYAGLKDIGWEFYDRNCKLACYDKNDIKATLAKDKAYQFIYR